MILRKSNKPLTISEKRIIIRMYSSYEKKKMKPSKARKKIASLTGTTYSVRHLAKSQNQFFSWLAKHTIKKLQCLVS